MTPARFYTFLICLLAFAAQQASAQDTQRMYLSGTGSDHTVKWQFYCTAGPNSGKWTTIPVPSNWELQGFGKYDYGWAKDTVRGKEKGLYKYEFKVPAAYKGKVVQLVFEGAMTDVDVKINGKPAGPTHQGAYYAFKYDVSSLLKYGGANVLEATVAKHSANKSVNEAERKGDFWIFGGIFRPVYLQVLPVQHISRISLDAQANGEFRSNVYLKGAPAGSTVSAQIFTTSGQKVGSAFMSKTTTDSVITMQTKVASPKLWSPEEPNLYKVEFSLTQNGKVVHTITKRFGFRTVEVKQRDGVYVNGYKIKFKGVNRHSFWPTTGRALNKTRSIEDVKMMKDLNMNAVRMSHYPPDDHFLDVCDSLGLFVMDELAGWHGHYDTPTGTKLAKALIEHDENHPSVVFWINGNEGGHNYELDPLFRKLDMQKRPVIHAWEDFGGFDTQHYRDYNYGIGSYNHGHSIVMPTEFLHGLYDGGSGAGLEDYWTMMWNDPLSAGGFLWDFADEGVVRTDKNGMVDTDGNQAADGIVGPYHEKEGSYFTVKEIWAPVFFERREIASGFDGVFHIENRYNITNLNQCKFTGKLVRVSDTYGKAKPAELDLAIASPNIEPMKKGDLKVNLPSDFKSYDLLYITAIDRYGHELFTWSWPIARPEKVARKLVVKDGKGNVKVEQTDSLYQVSANGIKLSFSKTTGLLREVENAKGKIPFTNGPILQEGETNFKNFTQKMDGKAVVIESTFDKKSAFNTLQWTIYPTGWVKMKVRYFPGDYFTNFVGVNFSFPEKTVKSVEYMGSGPYRVWKNRMKGTKLGVWKKDYNDTETGEKWVYPEFKGYHANMYWLKFNTTGQPFTVVAEDEDTFFRLFSPKPHDDQWHNYVIKFPSGDISFMQGISAIGNKTLGAEDTGPAGMKNIYYDYDKTPMRAKELNLYFDFSGR
ncbi:glycoside hydrolase family 2 [Mucilaginibacter daejeonensis]|uniref:glycoside hydrolase family 2 protein n=1 Tax=Mucilaginibacter daejeonensis TaxID=398049 RepID=UPI001D1799FF|nr:glycoside hydrolase family 2 TIM barrel-domain containing protein [Mucilaginibacter daejeonensis]UEG52843.1 glycoside hydrolase family 2 [Mucilaginibacter daejeonensis]